MAQGTFTTTSTLAADLVPLLIKERMLMISERNMTFYQLAQKETLPPGMGKTVQFTRYERLPLPLFPASEGNTPNSIPLTTAVVQAIVDQWISVVTLTDMGILTVRHPVLRVAQDRLGTQHSELIDRELEDTLAGGTNVAFAGGRTSRSSLVAGDVTNTDLIRQIVANLRNQGAPSLEGGLYAGVVDPFMEMDISKDATFTNASSYSNIRTLLNGEIGTWMGVRWMRSNFIPIITYMSTAADTAPQFTFAAATAGLQATGFTAAGGNVVIQVTKLDPQSGQELLISAVRTVTAAGAAWSLDVTQAAASTAGTYNFYVGLQGSSVPVFQTSLVLGNGAGAVVARFYLAGAQSLTSTPPAIVVQATGQVGPPAAPQVGTSGAGPTVHRGYIFGKESFGVIDLAGLETFLTPATPTDSDPAVQRRSVSWKQPWKGVVLNPSFFSRFEAVSAFA